MFDLTEMIFKQAVGQGRVSEITVIKVHHANNRRCPLYSIRHIDTKGAFKVGV